MRSESREHGVEIAGASPSTPPVLGFVRRIGGSPRDMAIQLLVLLGAIGFVVFVLANVVHNVNRLGVKTGFDFLDRPTGFDIAQTLIPYTSSSTYLTAFWVAVLNTAVLTLICIVLSTLLGLGIGLARLSSNPLLSGVAAAFVGFTRNIPLLLQLLFWYFIVIRALPPPRSGFSLFNLVFLSNRGLYMPAPEAGRGLAIILLAVAIGLSAGVVLYRQAQQQKMQTGSMPGTIWFAPLPILLLPLAVWLTALGSFAWSVPVLQGFNYTGGVKVIPEFAAMVLGLSVYSSAFTAEIFRGGFNAVSGGLREAGLALGLRGWLVNIKIVIPLALRAIIPPLGAQYVIILKNSSLAAAIAYPDLVQIFAGTALNQTGQPLEVMFMTLSAYLALGLMISLAINTWNRRLALVLR